MKLFKEKESTIELTDRMIGLLHSFRWEIEVGLLNLHLSDKTTIFLSKPTASNMTSTVKTACLATFWERMGELGFIDELMIFLYKTLQYSGMLHFISTTDQFVVPHMLLRDL